MLAFQSPCLPEQINGIAAYHDYAVYQRSQLSHIEIFRRFLNIEDSEAQKWFKNALTFCSDKNKKSIKDF
ncbi:MAG: hypothetical protein PHF87_04895, partial [Desulfotomaculaceae bacterium]|nr:hypothetical protein [Desulfotomaculaceae bacterium]